MAARHARLLPFQTPVAVTALCVIPALVQRAACDCSAPVANVTVVLKYAGGCDSAVRACGVCAVCISANCVSKVAIATDAVSNDSGCESATCDCSALVANVTAVLKNASSCDSVVRDSSACSEPFAADAFVSAACAHESAAEPVDCSACSEPLATNAFVSTAYLPQDCEPVGCSTWSGLPAADAFVSAALAHEAGEPVGCSVCSKPLCVDANDSAEYVDSMLLLNAVCMPPVAKAAFLRPDGSVKLELVPGPAFVLELTCDSVVSGSMSAGQVLQICVGQSFESSSGSGGLAQTLVPATQKRGAAACKAFAASRLAECSGAGSSKQPFALPSTAAVFGAAGFRLPAADCERLAEVYEVREAAARRRRAISVESRGAQKLSSVPVGLDAAENVVHVVDSHCGYKQLASWYGPVFRAWLRSRPGAAALAAEGFDSKDDWNWTCGRGGAVLSFLEAVAM